MGKYVEANGKLDFSFLKKGITIWKKGAQLESEVPVKLEVSVLK